MTALQYEDIQGLVMSGFGHLGHGLYLFLRFTDAQKGRDWIKRLRPRIANGVRWPKDADGKTIKPQSAINLALSFAGLGALGLPEDSLSSFPHEFQQGMAHPDRSRILGDINGSAPESWEYGGPNSAEIHAIVVLLALSPQLRESIRAELVSLCGEYEVEIVAEQRGDKLADSREHFGFFDGISQPALEDGVRKSTTSEPTIKTGEFVLGYKNEYDQIPLAPTLKGQDLGKNGSYLVFRKLHQDVAAFWKFVAEQRPAEAEIPQLEGADEAHRQIWLAAKMVGRWPSGVPLAMSPDKDDPELPFEKYNHFYFNTRDPHGVKCPFGSHVRRTNPRDSLPPDREESLKFSNRHLIIRRGLPYGDPLFALEDLPPAADVQDDGGDRGLIFICVNANIARQFEFVQQTWIENTKFHGLYNDKDPLIGGCDGMTDLTIQNEPLRYKVRGIPRFVNMRGGGYFFLPGLAALDRISSL